MRYLLPILAIVLLCCSPAPAQQAPSPQQIAEIRSQAERGNKISQHNLGVLYVMGQVVPTDGAQAYTWWLLASAQGNADAQKNIPLCERNLTPARRAQGERLAREFKPVKSK